MRTRWSFLFGLASLATTASAQQVAAMRLQMPSDVTPIELHLSDDCVAFITGRWPLKTEVKTLKLERGDGKLRGEFYVFLNSEVPNSSHWGSCRYGGDEKRKSAIRGVSDTKGATKLEFWWTHERGWIQTWPERK